MDKSRRALRGISFLTLFVVLLCLVLGLWQIQRLKWKENLLKSLIHADLSAFKPLEDIIDPLKGQDLKKVWVKGHYRHDFEVKVILRTYKGKVGAYLLTPLTLPSKQTIFINRGWIPQESHSTPIERPLGEVKVLGFLRQAEKPSLFTPFNDPFRQQWFYINLKEFAQFIEKSDKALSQSILPFYIMVKPSDQKSYPYPCDMTTQLSNSHLSYALTWFSLAFVLILVYTRYSRSFYS